MASKMSVHSLQNDHDDDMHMFLADPSRNSVVIGDVNGQLADVFAKLAKLHAKNSFAFAIVAGNLFAHPDAISEQQNNELHQLINASIPVPLPTYFALGKTPLPSTVVEKLTSANGELCPNLFVLGRKVSIKTSDGFKLVAIGGAHMSDAGRTPIDKYVATHTDIDVQSAEGFNEADILMTTDWPTDIQAGSKVLYPGELPTGSSEISTLCAQLKPRYHFTTSEAFFEREPFFHSGPPPHHITRFISLAALNNAQKHKAMYAFSLEPSAAPPKQLPDDCTASPLLSKILRERKRKLETEDGENGFRFASRSRGEYHDYDSPYRHPKRPRQRQLAQPQDCFFCLAGENVGTHMIASIGEDVYMTIAKGPLTTRDNFPSLSHPLHLLIIPLQHAPTFASMEAASRQSTVAEMQRYREALHNLISVKSTKGHGGEASLGAVTWEISRGGGVHLHWQFLPVPVNLVSRGLVEVAFEVEAENLSYPKFVKKAAEIAEAEEGDYFKVMIWCESMQREIVLPFEKGFRFDLQFGRRVLGKLLHLEHRTHWKDCIQDQDEETADAAAFQKMFKLYDPAEQARE